MDVKEVLAIVKAFFEALLGIIETLKKPAVKKRDRFSAIRGTSDFIYFALRKKQRNAFCVPVFFQQNGICLHCYCKNVMNI